MTKKACTNLANSAKPNRNFNRPLVITQKVVELNPQHIGANPALTKFYLAANVLDKAENNLSTVEAAEPANLDAKVLWRHYLCATIIASGLGKLLIVSSLQTQATATPLKHAGGHALRRWPR